MPRTRRKGYRKRHLHQWKKRIGFWDGEDNLGDPISGPIMQCVVCGRKAYFVHGGDANGK